jgi:hypothetical protein
MTENEYTFSSDELQYHQQTLLAFSRGEYKPNNPLVKFDELEPGTMFATTDRGNLLRVVTQISSEDGIKRIRCKTIAKLEFNDKWTMATGVTAGEGTFIGEKTWNSSRNRTVVFLGKWVPFLNMRPATDRNPDLDEIKRLLKELVEEVKAARLTQSSHLTDIFNALMGPSGVPYLGRLCEVIIREEMRKKKNESNKVPSIERRLRKAEELPIGKNFRPITKRSTKKKRVIRK